MPIRYRSLHILGLMLALACAFVTASLAAQAVPREVHLPAENAAGIIVLDKAAPQEQSEMPPVAFDHDAHTRALAESRNQSIAQTCSSCHETASGSLSRKLRGTKDKTGKDAEKAFHESCISCHTAMKGAKKAPQKAECRSCHNTKKIPSGTPAHTDGGLDPALHARHIASAAIVPVEGAASTCSRCHHPVNNPLSPTLKADSCRSCHPSRAEAAQGSGKPQPAFADAAHNRCISCHLALSPESGGTVKAPLTCTACHSAKAKAAYARPHPVPRLDAGQPDARIMGTVQALPPAGAAPTPEAPPGTGLPTDVSQDVSANAASPMPPVVFNHARHEKAADSCRSCHHKTLQSCSSCHTPTGSAKGGNVTLNAAMHASASDRSCVGCHETRKAKPECAGCHASMPKKQRANTCAGCHTPPGKPVPAPAAAPAATTPLTPKPDVRSMQALAATAERSASAAFTGLEAAPETVTIGGLSDLYEPVVMPHGAMVRALAAAITDTAPGMKAFHTSPYALCASCHHNSPPGPKPLACVTCHAGKPAANASATALDKQPPLQTAYHKQCMSCHTRMRITKPANADCVACHVRRNPAK